MARAYLLDENIPGKLMRAIHRHNSRGLFVIDGVRVGESDELPLGSADPDILIWAEKSDRILLSLDEHTMPKHLANHLQNGRHLPGLFLVRPNASIPDVVEFLSLVAHASDVAEWQDRIEFIPW